MCIRDRVKLRFQGIVTGVQRKGYSGQTVNTTGLAIIMDLNEVIGLAGFLGSTRQAGLTNYFDSHLFFSFISQMQAPWPVHQK